MEKDKQKLVKSGFATPRGGSKGAYQNHVVRSNKVIIPFERLAGVDLSGYKDGYVVRVFPEQYFLRAAEPHPEFLQPNAPVRIGEDAFILYRTHASLAQYPPLPTWQVRRLVKDGREVDDRGPNTFDAGHYVLRISTLGAQTERVEGPPQGLFAPEYADTSTNYLCKAVLAWLIVHTDGSPYTATQASHLTSILEKENLLQVTSYEFRGVMRHGLSTCPLCSCVITHSELHDTVFYGEADALSNASVQVEGSTRSTIVNLFHVQPLEYESLHHLPANVAWGHAHCNTKLGQRRCYSLAELQEMTLKVAIITQDDVQTFGWISEDRQMIRSPLGAVWIRIAEDSVEPEPQSEASQEE